MKIYFIDFLFKWKIISLLLEKKLMKIQCIDYFSRLMKNYFTDEKSNEVSTLLRRAELEKFESEPKLSLFILTVVRITTC
jgi:hypothetical protein